MNYKMTNTNACAVMQMTFLHDTITHQTRDLNMRGTFAHTRILSHADKTTQKHPVLKPTPQTRAEEASGDGQLNDRLIDSPNHADVHFADYPSI